MGEISGDHTVEVVTDAMLDKLVSKKICFKVELVTFLDVISGGSISSCGCAILWKRKWRIRGNSGSFGENYNKIHILKKDILDVASVFYIF